MKRNYWEIVQSMPAADLTDLMRRFERPGLYGVWVPQLHSPPFASIAAIAMVTTRIQLRSAGSRSRSRAARSKPRLARSILIE